MSICSSIYADTANATKDRWTKKLEEAIESGDMERVCRVVEEIKEFRFSE